MRAPCGRVHKQTSSSGRVLSSLNLKGSEADRVRQRYVKYFGAMNQVTTISNHTLVFLNAPGLVEEDYQRARHPGMKDYQHYETVKGSTVDFVRSHAPSMGG